MEDGTLASDIFNHVTIPEEDRKKYAKLIFHAVFQMVFRDNFLHADMHPGNILLGGLQPKKNPIKASTRPESNNLNVEYCCSSGEERIVLLDGGICASLSIEDRQNFIDLFHCIATNQGYRAGMLIAERSKHGLEGCIHPEEFANQIQELVQSVHNMGLSLGKIGVAELLTRVLALCYTHRVKLDASFVRVVLGMAVVEGLGKRVDPDVNLLVESLPYIMAAKQSHK